jgi:RNA polymerase sigma factor (TIGR02999 family)
MLDRMSDVTLILERAGQGDAQAANELLPLVYEELRKLAASKMAKEKPGQTLQATALVHEAWLRLGDSNRQEWRGREHFFSAAAEAMRRILVENARRNCVSGTAARWSAWTSSSWIYPSPRMTKSACRSARRSIGSQSWMSARRKW